MSKVKFHIIGNGTVHRRASDILKSSEIRGRVTRADSSNKVQRKDNAYTRGVTMSFTAEDSGKLQISNEKLAERADPELAAG